MLSAEPNKLKTEQDRPRLDRSPHPYSRQSLDLPNRIHRTDSLPNVESLTVSESYQSSDSRPSSYKSRNSDRAKLTTSPSDSGTEADDERPLLRAITAPPLRPRKGLRIQTGASSASPLLTPLQLDNEQDPFVWSPLLKQKPAVEVKEQETKDEKVQKRRRYIVLRRTVETLLLCWVGTISYGASTGDYRGVLGLQAAVISSVYIIYTVQILARRSWLGWNRAGQLGIRIPIAKDPAPILYPVSIPVYVALVSSSHSTKIILANLILSICSIPTKAIPFYSGHVQWCLSLLPLFYREWEPLSIVSWETVTLLFPLHRALLGTLEYLTTTSLLSTELQLLTVGMINLLLFANSPQALIVKALLWIGGLTLFVLCKDVLRWTVTLARIPSWRYRQVKHGIFKRSPIFRTIDGLLGGWLSSKIETSLRQEHSGSDDEEAPQKLQKVLTKPTRKNSEDMARSTNQQRATSNYSDMVQNSRQRRYTLPATPSSLSEFQLRRTASIGLQKIRDRPRSFQALTSAQAVLLKWIYAAYTYVVVVGTILIPVRCYIGYYALNRHEPFGWALGYLFGSLPAFRLQIVYWQLDRWIPLPLYDTSGSRLPEPSTTRLLITAHIFGTLIFGIIGVLTLAPLAEVDTRRKLFHGMMVTMFLPTILIDPCFVALALALALAVFLLLDLFRASQLPPLSRPLTIFLAPYVDGRDHRGPVIVSHIFLLIGCAIPLWLELAAIPRTGKGALANWTASKKGLGLISGVVCVGMGDAAASLIGRRWGRRRWPWGGGKSLEGSAAFAAAVVVGLIMGRCWIHLLSRWENNVEELSLMLTFGKALLAACGASFTEAVLTGANDNVLVPIVLWLLVKGLAL